MNIKNQMINFFSPLSLGVRSRSGVRLLLVILLALLTACTENTDLHVREVPPQPPVTEPDEPTDPTTGQVNIAHQWATDTDATALRYCFYPTAETPGEAIYADGSAEGFQGELPAGAYQMMAYNASATGVRFVDTDRWQTAAVELTAAATRSSYTLVRPMPQVFATAPREALTVVAGQTHTHSTQVRKLTRTFVFTFSLGETVRVGHLAGTLCGVYSALLLASDQPTAAARQAAPRTAVRFDVDGWTAGQQTTQISIPGLLDPQNGAAYDNRMALQVSTTDGTQWDTTVDLNGALTQILAENGGKLPVEVPVEMEIEISRTSVGISATVQGWGDSGNGETEL